jgi:signal transduction histidine kinase
LLLRLPGPALLAIVAAVYFALAQFVIRLNDPVQLGAGFWPAAGVSLGLLLLLPGRRWPWVLGGIAVAEFGGDLIHGYQVGAIGFWTAGNVVEPLVGAFLIRRFSSEHGALTPLKSLVGFIVFGVIIGPFLGATIGSLGTILGYASPAAIVWPKYVVGDALGVLVVAPVLLTWRQQSLSRSWREAGALAVSATAVTLLVFRNWDVVWDVTLPYLIVPFLMWAGLRFGLPGVALMGFLVANVANWATAMGYGPFAIAGGAAHAVTLLQLYLGITLISSLVLASLAGDLTDSREMARQQAEHTAEIERSREFRDAFIGVLSHEIRTPITTIYGMSEILRKRHASLDAATMAQYLEDISTESDRLRRLTEDLLVLSRAQGNGLQLAANPMALGHLVRKTVNTERARAADRPFTVDVPSGLPIVLGEDVYVEQVLRNFLGNAAKYSPPGTPIRVAVRSEARGVAVRVVDAGPGLPDGPPERLFELFYRAPDAIGTSAGAGVGLFVCHALVEAMGGRVWASEAETGGAEFGFWLPTTPDTDPGEDREGV